MPAHKVRAGLAEHEADRCHDFGEGRCLHPLTHPGQGDREERGLRRRAHGPDIAEGVDRRDLREQVGILREGAQVIGTDDLKAAARLQHGGIIADAGHRVSARRGPPAGQSFGQDVAADF